MDWVGYGPEDRSWVPRSYLANPRLLRDFYHENPQAIGRSPEVSRREGGPVVDLPMATPDSLQLRRSSRRLQNTSGTWSRRSVIVNHPMAPHLPRWSRSSSRFHGSSSPVYPNAPTSTAPPDFHRPRPSSRHFIHSGDSSPQLIPSGSHGSTSSSRDSLEPLTERLCHIYSHPRIIKCLRAYRTLRVCLVIFGSVLRSIEILQI